MGSADVLRLLLEIEFDETQEAMYLATCTIDGREWGTQFAHCFLENGAVECLRYMHEQGCEWDTVTCMGATKSKSCVGGT